jgi:hypothetical protein
MFDQDEFKQRLQEEFDCSPGEREKVAKQAHRLSKSGIYEKSGDGNDSMTVESAIESMNVAPDHISISGKWNYWMGLLNYSDQDYEQFKV